ncbi:MAG TPA: class I SAM-dependent methyltransferase [Burkholderiales bacterium]|nr:class I SAM-dependent methyltransferase [Burkholderiales bacterium]
MNTRLVPGRRRALAALGVAAAWPWLAHAQQNAGPYVPTPWKIVEEMLNLADIRADDFVMDLGSGDGRLVISAAERFGARGYGVDIDRELVKLANENAAKAGVAARVRFEERDLFETRLGEATVLTLYLLPHTVTQLVPRILAEMRPGARVVSHDYPLVPWQPDRHLQFELPEKVYISGTTRTVLYLYTVPARVGGDWTLELPPALGRERVRVSILQQPARLLGTATIGGTPASLEKLVVRGEAVSFEIPNLRRRGQSVRFSGRARGDVIEGVVALPGGEVPWRATRAAGKS